MVEPIERGLINAVKPRINAMLAIFESQHISYGGVGLSAKAALAETIISGAEEPMARIVIPITSGETP
jgi:hypothetical protein